MFSTLVGHSGREYVRQNCNGKLFILKPVSLSIFDLLQEFKDEFGNNLRLRIHTDGNENKNVLVYEYFKSDLLSLVENYPALQIEARKTILKEHWIHLDVKPNNVFLNWYFLPTLYVDEKGQFQLEKVALGDMDCALKLEGQKLLNQRMGNVMWRSTEGELGKGVGKPSECLYVITGAQRFHPDFEKLDIEPEPIILFNGSALKGPVAEDESNEAFEQWSEEMFPNLDNEAKRALMSDIIMDLYWN
ncbi:uncharacterized protein K444DRAFT_645720 [Hyaloscypha bicolor E]|uniref:Protein kinase domain-containing protein n=1 Tax=Hyaloscypha bicolor E TaxID=1095630 RepID=A0A2J6SXQ5_9HELO|nr:uncharacterized protein K444DRAFT_645720 [Hyaloscypha bicolor E]PMD55550.1 hypothetical protein K444DRAFT_645720 [Hyaloscypha bicolor E]